MAAESRRNFSLLSKAFSGNFLRDFYPSRAQLQFNGKQKPHCVSIGKNPVKSDTELALIEGMLMNLMFLVIYIPVVLFENWLRVTHSQRRECLRPHRGSNAALAC